MSIIGKHYYRTAFLGSEEWKTLRIAALARDGAKCTICGHENNSNDAHHVYYPESVWDTKVEHLVTLCRSCHNLVHVILPSSPETIEEGKSNFELLRKTLSEWIETKSRQLRQRIEEGGTCWFCDTPNSVFRDLDFKDLGVIQPIPNRAICDKCFESIVESPQWNSEKPWRAIRKMLITKRKNRALTNFGKSDSVLATGPDSPENAE